MSQRGSSPNHFAKFFGKAHHRKKGVIEVQFNWIFILISGALILFLFTSIILKQKTTADSTAQTTLLKDITSIAVGSEATTGVTKEIALSKATITFGCNSIRIGQRSQPLQQMVIFSPTVVQTPLIVHTREWSVPFRATNVVYLSSPKVRYVLIGNNALAQQINKSMPEKFLKDVYRDYNAFHTVSLQDDDHLRIVFLDQSEFNTDNNNQLFSKLSSKSSSEVSILVVSGNQNVGEAKFYTKTQTSFQLLGTTEYLKEEMLIGAIFTNSIDQYSCIQANMLKKLRTVADIHDKRRVQLALEMNDPFHLLNRCHADFSHSNTATDFSIIKSTSNFNNLYAAAYGPLIAGTSNGLSNINKQLERLSCPLLY